MATYTIGDIHDVIKTFPKDSFDLVYWNPPFATTQKKWDSVLDFPSLFKEIDRVLKPTGVLAIHTAIPFTYKIIALRQPKYHYTWVKNNPTGFFQAKKQPLRQVEEILIYYKGPHTYNPQMIGTEVHHHERKNKYTGDQYYGDQKPNVSHHVGRFPTTFMGRFKRIIQKKSPKSISNDIIERIIKTYTNEGDSILDPTCCDRGIGTIAESLNRIYQGVDISDEFIFPKLSSSVGEPQ